jgi:putative spermidine/putrescine transport system substrate-binding protein
MWRGDPSVNRYVDTWVAPRLAQRFGVTLNAVPGQGADLVNTLVVERDVHRRTGTIDLVWINGETFFNLRREGLLYGPWAGRLPNAADVDSASPLIARDFEQVPDGYESPWGTVQFALFYDTVRTPHPPETYEALARWIHEHPGRFTYDQQFTGLTFIKGLMYALNGGVARFQGGFDSVRYAAARDRTFAWLERVRPDLWRGGVTYPQDIAQLDRLFANGEVDFAMSNNQNDLVTNTRSGIFPPTARGLVLHDGTIANTHYVGIPFNAPNPAGAMVVANFLLSHEAQDEKAKPEVWADGTVLKGDTATHQYAVPEVAPEYSIHLQDDWRARIRR